MKTLPTQRVVPLRPPKGGRVQKKDRLRTDLDVRRHKALEAYWDAQIRLGRQLSLVRIGRRKGLQNGHYAHHLLHGRAALNVEWMLYFAEELGVAPQTIWKGDWPFPQMTASTVGRDFQRMFRRWAALSVNAKRRILAILDGDNSG